MPQSLERIPPIARNYQRMPELMTRRVVVAADWWLTHCVIGGLVVDAPHHALTGRSVAIPLQVVVFVVNAY